MQIIKKVFSCEGFAIAFPKLVSILTLFILGLIIGNYYGQKNCKNKTLDNKSKKR